MKLRIAIFCIMMLLFDSSVYAVEELITIEDPNSGASIPLGESSGGGYSGGYDSLKYLMERYYSIKEILPVEQKAMCIQNDGSACFSEPCDCWNPYEELMGALQIEESANTSLLPILVIEPIIIEPIVIEEPILVVEPEPVIEPITEPTPVIEEPHAIYNNSLIYDPSIYNTDNCPPVGLLEPKIDGFYTISSFPEVFLPPTQEREEESILSLQNQGYDINCVKHDEIGRAIIITTNEGSPITFVLATTIGVSDGQCYSVGHDWIINCDINADSYDEELCSCPVVITPITCSEWSECTDSIQSRECNIILTDNGLPSVIETEQRECTMPEDSNKGYGNDPDGCDDDNPGKSCGKGKKLGLYK